MIAFVSINVLKTTEEISDNISDFFVQNYILCTLFQSDLN